MVMKYAYGTNEVPCIETDPTKCKDAKCLKGGKIGTPMDTVDEVTALDGIVYTHALNISLRHIRATEVEANQSITCIAHLVALRRQLVYMPGALAALDEWIFA